MKKHTITITCVVLALICGALHAAPGTLAPPNDPTQSITYWKPHVIAAQNDQDVAMAHDIFQQLLGTWDGARVEPNLYVVTSDGGPWAASLADGNILLTRSSIDICMQFGPDKAKHLLAFILGHELAHQKADDLWHQKFLRLAGSQAPRVQQQLLANLPSSETELFALEQKEAQADHEGLLIMASVGFDPFSIVDDKDFYTTWVENIWNTSCAANENLKAVCDKARTRALRTMAQLKSIATQSVLYEMGIQAYVAADYENARRYFTAYGKDYPSRQVYINLALSYLTPALNLQQLLTVMDKSSSPMLYYPFALDNSPLKERQLHMAKLDNTRAVSADIKRIQQQKRALVENAVNHLEKAVKLQPQYPNTYLWLALAYLLDDNTHMANGIVQGKYVNKFGEDDAAKLVSALAHAEQNDITKAQQLLQSLMNQPQLNSAALPEALLKYAVHANSALLAQHLNQAEKAKHAWQSLAVYARKQNNSALFQLAVGHINAPTSAPKQIIAARGIEAHRIGDTLPVNLSENTPSIEFWLEGEPLRLLKLSNGARWVIDSRQTIIATWQQNPSTGQRTNDYTINIGDAADRPLKEFGAPSRRVDLINGTYLAYDAMGIAFRINHDKIDALFLYEYK